MSTTENTAVETNPVPAEICDAVRGAKNIALVGHVTPDADCLGVIGAMSLALAELGKYACASLPGDSVARRLQFLCDMAGVKPATS